jgi:hypothetical protein
MTNTITASEFLAIEKTNLPALQFQNPDAAWRGDAWTVVRDVVDGLTYAESTGDDRPVHGDSLIGHCGSRVLAWSALWDGAREVIVG